MIRGFKPYHRPLDACNNRLDNRLGKYVLPALGYAAVILVCVALSTGCGQSERPDTESRPLPSHGGPARIVSMAPNITETLFALGLGSRVAGVTRFCLYPPEANNLPSIGGFLDPNYEAIAALAPDMVLTLPEQDNARRYLDELSIPHETLHNRTVAEILDSIAAVGALCGVEARADSLLGDIRQRMAHIAERTADSPRPRVLLSIGRTRGTGSIRDVYAAGKGTFYDELVSLAGGTNVVSVPGIAYPELSAEGVLHLDPGIIIELAPELAGLNSDASRARSEWDTLPGVSAEREGNVYILTGDYTMIPVPRFILLLEDMARLVHPNAF